MFPEVIDHQCFITTENKDSIVKFEVDKAIKAGQRVIFARPDAANIMKDIVDVVPDSGRQKCFVRDGSYDCPAIGIFIFTPEELSELQFHEILQSHGMEIVNGDGAFDKDFVILGMDGEDVSRCHKFFSRWLSVDPLSN